MGGGWSGEVGCSGGGGVGGVGWGGVEWGDGVGWGGVGGWGGAFQLMFTNICVHGSIELEVRKTAVNR